MISIGFTGTRKGMTENQLKTFNFLIKNNKVFEFHHGDCVGADKEAHLEIIELLRCDKIIIHPPIAMAYRAYCKLRETGVDEIREPKTYLERNKDIVDESDMLIAAPESIVPKIHSGTWSTINYAKRKGKSIVILYPN